MTDSKALSEALAGARNGHERARRVLRGYRQMERSELDYDLSAELDSAELAEETGLWDDHWLTPILVEYFSRDGSTLMMRLLSTAPQISVEGPYPYERKYFAYLYRWAMLLDRTETSAEGWSFSDLGSIWQAEAKPVVGPPPWLPRRSYADGEDGLPMSRWVFETVWQEFSERASRLKREGDGDQPVSYYAEKHLHTWRLDLDSLPDLRVLVLLRDPRDSYLSIGAFNEKRRGQAPMIGRKENEPEEGWLKRFIKVQQERLRWISSVEESEEFTVVRYDDLVNDLPRLAAELGEELSVDLDPEAAVADEAMRAQHVTASSPEDSVQRWRREMSPELRREFANGLGDELNALGFEPG